MRPDELERRLRDRLNALGPAPREELLHVLMLPDFSAPTGSAISGDPETRAHRAERVCQDSLDPYLQRTKKCEPVSLRGLQVISALVPDQRNVSHECGHSGHGSTPRRIEVTDCREHVRQAGNGRAAVRAPSSA